MKSYVTAKEKVWAWGEEDRGGLGVRTRRTDSPSRAD